MCILDKKVIGFIIYYERHYINDIGNFLSIEFMLIDKLYQRNGYGNLIIEYLKEQYHDKNYISVCIENKNKYINFYKNIGFKEFHNEPLKKILTEDGYNHVPLEDVNITPDNNYVHMKLTFKIK